MKLSPKAQKQLDKVVNKFKDGDLSPIVNVVILELPEDAPAKKWTLANRAMAFAQTGSLDCRGYKQWIASGRQVKKGSHAGFIFYPRMTKKENAKGEKEPRCIGFGSTAVFAVDDTEGDPVADYEPKQAPLLLEVAERLGVSVEYAPLIDGTLGFCKTDNSTIKLATHDESIFFHELAHAAHNTFEQSKGKQDPRRETVADLTACVLMGLYGIRDNTGNTWKYIKSYNADPLKAIMKALSTIERVLAVIFEDKLQPAI